MHDKKNGHSTYNLLHVKWSRRINNQSIGIVSKLLGDNYRQSLIGKAKKCFLITMPIQTITESAARGNHCKEWPDAYSCRVFVGIKYCTQTICSNIRLPSALNVQCSSLSQLKGVKRGCKDCQYYGKVTK